MTFLYKSCLFQSILARIIDVLQYMICLIRHFDAASIQKMAQNLYLLTSGIRDEIGICKYKFCACYAHPKLKRQEWLRTTIYEFKVWSLGLNGFHCCRSSLYFKIRHRAKIREDTTDLHDALAECLSKCSNPSRFGLIPYFQLLISARTLRKNRR